MTQKTTLPTNFVGTGIEELPKFVTSAPVSSGLLRRYTTEPLDSTLLNQPVPSVPDIASGGTALSQSVAAERPILREASGRRFLEFDGVNDSLSAGSAGAQGSYSFVAVGRFRSAQAAAGTNWPIFALNINGGGVFSMSPSGVMAAFASLQLIGAGSPGTAWQVFQVVLSGAASVARVDDTEVSGNTGNLPNPANLHVGKGTAANTFAALDLAEVLVYNKALTLAERNTINTQFRSKYGI